MPFLFVTSSSAMSRTISLSSLAGSSFSSLCALYNSPQATLFISLRYFGKAGTRRLRRKPLDFEPGTCWQYSNTNYVVAGRIVERVTGGPFFAFLAKRVLQPLGMASAIDLDEQALGSFDAAGCTRFALGPPRPAPAEGRGWLYAAGELAMTPHDLALWDISLVDGFQQDARLKPASTRGELRFSHRLLQARCKRRPNIFNNLPLGCRRGGAEAPPFRGTG